MVSNHGLFPIYRQRPLTPREGKNEKKGGKVKGGKINRYQTKREKKLIDLLGRSIMTRLGTFFSLSLLNT